MNRSSLALPALLVALAAPALGAASESGTEQWAQPRMAWGAFSSTRTRAPSSRAAMAALSAALPAPTTVTS